MRRVKDVRDNLGCISEGPRAIGEDGDGGYLDGGNEEDGSEAIVALWREGGPVEKAHRGMDETWPRSRQCPRIP